MEVVGQGAGERTDQVIAPVLPEFHIEDVDLQHIAGLGAFDRDRPGQDMAGHHALTFGMHLVEFGRDMEFGLVRKLLRAARDGVHGDFVAAVDGQDRLEFRFEKAPVTGLGAGMQMMMGHGGSLELGRDGV